VVEILIANRADPNQADDDGNSAIMEAAAKDWTETCRCLLKNRAEINQ
jgi:ankyrin repeat protein